jgi:hypothetical protein
LPTRPCLREAEGEGVEPPRPVSPPVFETGYRACGCPSEGGPGRRRTCTVPGKNRELCRVELRSRDVTGRDRTCDAPRFRRALYELSYGHVRWAEPDSNRRPPPYQRGALPPELSATLSSGRGWARTSSLLFVRQALYPLELLARPRRIRDKESNLDLHVQSVASCRLDDPGAKGSESRLSVNPPHREIDAAGGPPPVGPWSRPLSVRPEAERCFLCHSPTLRPWITDRWLRTLAVVAVLRGGALEPEPRALLW